MANKPATFIDIVQEHERSWGTEGYAGRPTLSDLLQAPVVAWWRSVNEEESRLTATAHESEDELNQYAARLLLQSRVEMPDRRLAMVHVGQKKAVVRGVKLEIVVLNE